jgi:hypothetical protein
MTPHDRAYHHEFPRYRPIQLFICSCSISRPCCVSSISSFGIVQVAVIITYSISHIIAQRRMIGYHCQDSSFWAVAFLRRFCQITSGFHFFGSRNNNSFTGQGRRTWRTMSLYLCPPVTGWSSYTPGTGFRFPRLLRLAGLRWRYSNPPPHGTW